MIPGLSTVRLIGLGIGALSLIAFGLWIMDMRSDLRDLREWRGRIVATVQAEVPADRRESVTHETAADEIHWLGRELRTSESALADQSEKLRQAEKKTTAAQDAAAIARKRAVEADKARQALRDRLSDPERVSGLTADEWGEL